MPFFFRKAMERSGRKVQAVNIASPVLFRWPYDLVIRVLRRFGFQSEHDHFRSKMNTRLIDARIKRSLRKYPDAFPIFMTYSFGAEACDRQYALFSDRTFEHYIRYFNDREPDTLESRSVIREERNLDKASLIVSLFPDMAEKLAQEHGVKVKYYGNVVNLPALPPKERGDLEVKWRSKRILFIGKAHYKEGLIKLLKAMAVIHQSDQSGFEVDVIGTSSREVPMKLRKYARFHGYLNKSKSGDFDTYCNLLDQAFLFVNPNPRWASFSASCEAMYMNVPLLIPAYDEFTSTFGDRSESNWFLKELSPQGIADQILQIASNKEEWFLKAEHARKGVADFTWERYTQKLLLDVDQLGSE